MLRRHDKAGMVSGAARLLLRLLWIGILLIGMAGALVLFYPLDAKIDRVLAQPADPLPEVLRQAIRYSLSEDGSDGAVRFEAAKILVRSVRRPPPGPGPRLSPVLIAARLLVFSQPSQSERFVMEAYRARCWTTNLGQVKLADALYLAARTRAPAMQDAAFIRRGMRMIGQRMVKAGVISEQSLAEILDAPLPNCA
jgi:hypothetical protein